MTYKPRRPVSELPCRGTDIVLTYGSEQPAVPFEFGDTLETWHVKITRYHGEEPCQNCPEDEYCEFGEKGHPIGHMEFVRIRDFTRTPPGRRPTPTPVTSRRSSPCAPTRPAP